MNYLGFLYLNLNPPLPFTPLPSTPLFSLPPSFFFFFFLPCFLSFKLPDSGSFNLSHFKVSAHLNPWGEDLATGHGPLLPTSLLYSHQHSGLLSAKMEAIFSPLTCKAFPDLSFTWLFLLFSCTHGRSGCLPHHVGSTERLFQAWLPSIPTQPSQATALPVGWLLLESS